MTCLLSKQCYTGHALLKSTATSFLLHHVCFRSKRSLFSAGEKALITFREPEGCLNCGPQAERTDGFTLQVRSKSQHSVTPRPFNACDLYRSSICNTQGFKKGCWLHGCVCKEQWKDNEQCHNVISAFVFWLLHITLLRETICFPSNICIPPVRCFPLVCRRAGGQFAILNTSEKPSGWYLSLFLPIACCGESAFQ